MAFLHESLLVAAGLIAAVHCASLSLVKLGRDAWLEDFENIARQVCERKKTGSNRVTIHVDGLQSLF